jgi:single-stranded-DNA-specific exonuclease
LSNSEEEALLLSRAIEEYNATRKGLDKEITAQAIAKIGSDSFYQESFSTVIFDNDWHKGVVGIVASRLVETYYKPTIVLVSDGQKMAGSARSIEGIDLFECLNECSEFLTQFGGHTMAAGLSLDTGKFDAFRSKFEDVIQQKLNRVRPLPFIKYDAEIDFLDITQKLHRIIKQFEPFGPENLSPVFLTRKVQNKKFTRSVGENNRHLKLHVCQKKSPNVALEGIGFDLGKWAPMLQAHGVIDLLYSIEENHWNNKTTLQLVVKDIRESIN